MTEPIARAHSHNDYQRARPLRDALDSGFCSVEADIYLVDGELRVGHDPGDLVPGRTLEALYLNPLHDRWRAYGSIHPVPSSFRLLIDIKADAERVLPALEASLSRFAPMLRRFGPGTSGSGAVQVVLSGDRPIATVRRRRDRLYALDGRPENLGKGEAIDLFPMISLSWFGAIQWAGFGPMSRKDRVFLADLVDRCHAEGRVLRFWAAPDNPAGWSVLRAAGVDVLNTDHLPELARWLVQGRPA